LIQNPPQQHANQDPAKDPSLLVPLAHALGGKEFVALFCRSGAVGTQSVELSEWYRQKFDATRPFERHFQSHAEWFAVAYPDRAREQLLESSIQASDKTLPRLVVWNGGTGRVVIDRTTLAGQPVPVLDHDIAPSTFGEEATRTAPNHSGLSSSLQITNHIIRKAKRTTSTTRWTTQKHVSAGQSRQDDATTKSVPQHPPGLVPCHSPVVSHKKIVMASNPITKVAVLPARAHNHV
jgi:hypothetical protein